jgi:hypothetical protein
MDKSAGKLAEIINRELIKTVFVTERDLITRDLLQLQKGL